MSDADFFTRLMARLQQRDQDAWCQVYQRFARRLVILAGQRLDERLRAVVDPEDVVQSVFRTFCRRQVQGQFQPAAWEDLGQLLVHITICKCINQNKHHLRKRRDVSQRTGDADLLDASALDRDPLPEEVAMLHETVERLLAGLSMRDGKIVLLKLDNQTVQQIGREADCSERTVERVLELARNRLRRQLEK
jgi:RNA polymerase sigma factor (sigma-70 family)